MNKIYIVGYECHGNSLNYRVKPSYSDAVSSLEDLHKDFEYSFQDDYVPTSSLRNGYMRLVKVMRCVDDPSIVTYIEEWTDYE